MRDALALLAPNRSFVNAPQVMTSRGGMAVTPTATAAVGGAQQPPFAHHMQQAGMPRAYQQHGGRRELALRGRIYFFALNQQIY